ncbi:unnamed protein product [Pleuronectes platessa]|uniref:Uncharacterized protein n=1 Tax=Pleuronectes platessa TaxID=8262 RepID=A0A9N7Z3V8_PLEPL|nr:unnamed protein product [Pleuronectes platessa]
MERPRSSSGCSRVLKVSRSLSTPVEVQLPNEKEAPVSSADETPELIVQTPHRTRSRPVAPGVRTFSFIFPLCDEVRAQLPPVRWKLPIDANQLIDTLPLSSLLAAPEIPEAVHRGDSSKAEEPRESSGGKLSTCFSGM